jgi:hypothetical protein
MILSVGFMMLSVEGFSPLGHVLTYRAAGLAVTLLDRAISLAVPVTRLRHPMPPGAAPGNAAKLPIARSLLGGLGPPKSVRSTVPRPTASWWVALQHLESAYAGGRMILGPFG